MAGEELLDDADFTEDAGGIGGDVGDEGVELQEESSLRPKSDIFTLMLVLAFVAFLAGSIIAGRECWDNYDVQFLFFTKE